MVSRPPLFFFRQPLHLPDIPNVLTPAYTRAHHELVYLHRAVAVISREGIAGISLLTPSGRPQYTTISDCRCRDAPHFWMAVFNELFE